MLHFTHSHRRKTCFIKTCLFKTSLNKTTKRGSFKLVLIKATKEMADNIKEPSKKRTKRSRHWEEIETRISVNKLSEENIQERLKY